MVEGKPDYAAIRARIEAAGCLQRAPWRSWVSLVREVVLALACWSVAAMLPWWAAIPVFALGSLFFYRNGFVMHDAAHGGVYGKPKQDRVLATVSSMVLGEFVSGWKHGHNRHHAWPNVRGRDGDQSERWDPTRRYDSPVWASIELFLLNRLGKIRIPKSILLMGLRDGFYARSTNPDAFPVELAGVVVSQLVQIGVFTLLFGGWGLLAWLFHLHVGLVYLNAVFAGNHYDLENFSEEEARALDFASLQVRTARNYRAPAIVRFFLGGMENQIEHHLFPTLSRYELPRAAPLVAAWCAESGLPYEVTPFWETLPRVVRFHLGPMPAAITPASVPAPAPPRGAAG